MATDFYAVLGVPKDADAATIKKAYRKLARDLHPDKNAGNKAMETRFKEVNRAYEVVGDEAKRKLYDEFGEEALREGFDAEKARAYKQWQSRAGNGGGGFRGGGFGGGAVNLEDLFSGAVPGGSAGEGDPFARSVRSGVASSRPGEGPRLRAGAHDRLRVRGAGHVAPASQSELAASRSRSASRPAPTKAAACASRARAPLRRTAVRAAT